MGILRRVRTSLAQALAVDDPKAWDNSLWRLRQWISGEQQVDESTALTYSAVYNAVVLIAGTISTLPLHLISKKNGRTQRQESESAYHVLHTEANEYMTAMAFRECVMAHVLLFGNGYAEIVRDGYGNLVALWPITPDRVTIVWDGGLYYEIDMGPHEKKVILPREKVLHVAGLGFNGLQGYSVVGKAQRSIGVGMAMEEFGEKYFSQGTHPGIIVKHPGRLHEDGHENLRKSLEAAHSGLGQSHRLMLLEDNMTVEKIAIAPEEAQFLESRQFQIPEIARWFNLPPHKLKDLTRSSFSNIESEQISFVTDSILPWLIRLEQAFNMQLLSRNQKRRMYYKHSVEGLMRGSAKDRAEFYRQMWNIGAMSINDILDKEDMDPVENGYERFVPMNMVPLSRALADKQEPEAPDMDEIEQLLAHANGNGSGMLPAERNTT